MIVKVHLSLEIWDDWLGREERRYFSYCLKRYEKKTFGSENVEAFLQSWSRTVTAVRAVLKGSALSNRPDGFLTF